jgi:hypothetical protein
VGKMLQYFMAICNILCPFGIFYDHLVHIVFIWYIFSGFGIMHQKIGQPWFKSRSVSEIEVLGREIKSGQGTEAGFFYLAPRGKL